MNRENVASGKPAGWFSREQEKARAFLRLLLCCMGPLMLLDLPFEGKGAQTRMANLK
jgi:hypothetical protein